MSTDTTPNSVARAKSRVGVAARRGDQQALADARRELAEAKIDAYVKKVVAEAPAFTDEQRARLAALFRPALSGGGAHDDAA